MLTSQEVAEIKRRLEGGESLLSIAETRGESIAVLRNRLAKVGYRYTGTVVPARPVDAPPVAGAR